MPLIPASLRRRLLGLDARDLIDGTSLSFRNRELDGVMLRELPRSAGKVSGWIFTPGGKGRVLVATALGSMPGSALFEGAGALMERFLSLGPDPASADALLPALQELLLDQRVGDEGKLAFLAGPLGLALVDRLVPSIPRGLHSRLAAIIDLEGRWRDVDRNLEEGVQRLSVALLDAEPLLELRALRARLIEEKLAREAAERARIGEERRRAEEERIRLETLRREREEALRRALTLGRGKDVPDEFRMTEEFQKVFQLVEGGEKLLYVTGKPGTGKSTLVRALRDRLSDRNVVVVAFTGTAAFQVGGQTINSFFNLPLRMLNLGEATTSYRFKQRARALEILVVDEVSMLRPDMLDAMDASLRLSRGDGRPFGGVQVLLVGDLHQLPPVIDKEEAVQSYYKETYGGLRWFHAAKVLQKQGPRFFELTEVFRQEAGPFLDFLSEVRDSEVSGERLDWFNAQVRKEPDFPDSVFYLTVTPHRQTAARFNRGRLDSLGGPISSYWGLLETAGRLEELTKADGSYPTDALLELKPKAQVMFVKNDEGKKWVNGDLGIVEELSSEWVRVTTGSGTHRVERARWPKIRYEIDERTGRLIPRDDGAFVQFPLRLACNAAYERFYGNYNAANRYLLNLSLERMSQNRSQLPTLFKTKFERVWANDDQQFYFSLIGSDDQELVGYLKILNQFFLVLITGLVLISTIQSLIQPPQKQVFMMQLFILGMALLLLVTEAQTRYRTILIPYLVILAGMGMKAGISYLSKIFRKLYPENIAKFTI